MLALDRVTYRHPGQPAGYEFTLTAMPGEVTAISGPSGAGKSTLLDLIAGFSQASAGTIKLDGQELNALTPEERPVSILFQSDILFEHLSAGENIALGLPSGTGRSERAKFVARALSEVGLPTIARQRASSLSGGQKQRIALARTLLRDRPVLLLDEPFSALDDETRAAVRALVQDLTRARRWHTLLVSHYSDDVMALADRRYRIEDGRLLA